MILRSFTLSLVLCASAVPAEVGLVEEIIAKVNGDIITRSEVERSRRQLETELKQRGISGPALQKELTDRERDLLRERIDQLLLVQKGKELSINVDPDVSKYLAELQVGAKIADPDKFQAFVREQTGQAFEDYKGDLKNAFLTQRVVRQEVGGRITIPRAELEKYYNENKQKFVREERVFLREILVSTEGKDAAGVAAAEKKAKDLVARARKGERFGDLARENSDALTKEKYGELGAFKRDELSEAIRDAVFDKERGHITDPIKIQNGFWIGRVEEAHKAGQAAFEEVENEIMEQLYMPKFQPQVREYLTKLRQDAFLEIKEGYVDTGAAPGKSTKWTDPAQLKPETVTKEEVVNRGRRKRLLWLVPLPGTETAEGDNQGVSSSR